MTITPNYHKIATTLATQLRIIEHVRLTGRFDIEQLLDTWTMVFDDEEYAFVYSELVDDIVETVLGDDSLNEAAALLDFMSSLGYSVG